MRFCLTAERMKACDRNTIEHFGVASLVLQERAALAVCVLVTERYKKTRVPSARGRCVRIYAGPGNNGADGIACARILSQRGFMTEILLAGPQDRQTPECAAQLRSVRAYGLDVREYEPGDGGTETVPVPDVIIDGLLGVGINRAPAGVFDAAVTEINRLHDAGAYVIAVDMPSGLLTDDGTAPGSCVRADETVTFGFAKTGQLLYPGASYCGRLHVADIGITPESFLCNTDRAIVPDAFYFEREGDVLLPPRDPSGNKGTFGKVLVVAGSRDTGGAAILCAKAALSSGCGMVRVFTERINRDAILCALPEALIDVYDANAFDETLVFKQLDDALLWADAVVCGCGTGTGAIAQAVLKHLLVRKHKPLVLDADALNLLSLKENGLLEAASAHADNPTDSPLVLTPHVAEFARLYSRAFSSDVSVSDCKAGAHRYPALLAGKTGAVVVYKDARSVVSDGTEPFYVNLSGNDGMACAGSGDVLAGLLGALLAGTRGARAFETVCAGVFCHGLAGDLAAEAKGKRAMSATDLSDALRTVLRRIDDGGNQSGFVA